MSQLAEILEALAALPEKDRQAVTREAIEATKDMVWCPNPGPQTEAFYCEADELFYGGQAGGGKTGLEVGLALTEHKRSLLLRRTNKEADGLVKAIEEVVGHRNGYNSQKNSWRIGERIIDMGGCQLEEDRQKYKGDPHDLIAFDEVSDFTETQYTFIIGWNRSVIPGQRCRIVAAGNPPTRPEGLWVLKRWAAWLDPKHPKPAKPGELRWYTTDESGREIEVDGPGPHLIGGEEVVARSRTFIPARLSDNPDLASTNYGAVLAALPAELRAAYRDGRFDAGLEDDPWQAIPTDWVLQAQERWGKVPPVGVPMCAIGVDVAQGGTDSTVLAQRHDGWFAPLHSVPGAQTPGGTDVAGIVIARRRDNAKVVIDIGGGWGGDAYAHLKANGVDVDSYMGVKKSLRRTIDNQLTFTNVRTEAYWRLREALNPDQEGGSPIMLPDDRELLADLTAPTYSVKGGGLALEPKEDLIKRIGRSPDKGDAVVMAWFSGPKMASHYQQWKQRSAPPVVNMGRMSARRKH
jgi:hypothetical protein